ADAGFLGPCLSPAIEREDSPYFGRDAGEHPGRSPAGAAPASSPSDHPINREENGAMGRIAAFVYGVVAYAIFFATFLYAAGFVGNLVVPKSLDAQPVGTLGASLLINLGLLSLFP